MNCKKMILAPVVLAALATGALAEDAYFHVPVTALHFTEGALPTGSPPTMRAQVLRPYAALDGEGEAYVTGEDYLPWQAPAENYRNVALAVRAPKGKEVTGRLFAPKPDLSGMVVLSFKLEATAEKAEFKNEFYKAKESHYHRLRERNIAGGAWFRHQESEAAKARGGSPAAVPTGPGRFAGRPASTAEGGYDSMYELFSGGRALSENLQLERVLAPAGSNEALVEITNLLGITVREMDWKELVKDARPKKDTLAACIPFDQHALFFPSFEALSQWIEQADADGTPVLQMFEPRAEDANSRGRYEKQLCLELNELSRRLGPALIASVAVTGSDPYLRTGSDVAVLYESKSPGALQALLQARHVAVAAANSAVKAVSGEIEGVAYSGVVSPERAVCSYLAASGNVVFVCNSTYQLAGLLRVAKGQKPALATQDEYTFFRRRYPVGDAQETALLVLSDATIRRWCSPQWRIGNARRTRVAAALAELQAAHFEELAAGTVKTGPVPCALAEAGEVRLTPAGVISSTWGTLGFLTPIAEMPLAKVTQAEADAYNRWRTGYQQNWSQYFDPIAVRFSLGPQRLGAEITVMPLITGTGYRQFIAVSTGSSIAPDAGDRHPEALLHLAMAINPQSEPIKDAGNFVGNFSPSLKANPLGWFGQSLAVYADQDPFWEALSKAQKASEFLEQNYPQLPLALHCDVKNPLGLTAFLTALRAFGEQTAPRMTTWQNLEYNGQAYVKVRPAEAGMEGGPTNLCVYYAVTPKSLVLTLNEAMLKRALDRQSTRQAAKAEDKTAARAAQPWLGTNVCLQINREFVPAVQAIFHEEYRAAQQVLAWDNLPILNEWKRLYPAQDPVKLHEQFWQTKLLCPGGGAYVWNEKWHTMESTVYGHPGEPKPGPKGIRPLANFTGVNLGLSFESQGLSAKVVLERSQP